MPDEVTVEQALQIIDVPPSTQTVEVEAKTQVMVIKPDGKGVALFGAGPPGPRGLKGDKGDVGDSDLLLPLIVESPGAVTTWDISHPFDHDPSVEIRDTTDRVCLAPTSFSPGVVHIDISPSNITLKAKLTP